MGPVDSMDDCWKREKYFRAILNSLNEAIIVINKDRVVIDTNNYVPAIVGKTREEVINRKCFEVLHGRLNPCSLYGDSCYFEKVFETGESYKYRHLHRKADGTTYWVDVLLSPLIDEESKEIVGVVEASRDISDIINVEEALIESESMYRSIVENSSDLIMLTDSNGYITYLSPSVKEVLGYSVSDLVGKTVTDYLYLVNCEDVEMVQKCLFGAKRGKSRYNLEYRVTAKDGNVVWVSHSWSIIYDNNEVSKVVSIIRNVTYEKEIEELKFQRKQLLDNLEELKEALAQLKEGRFCPNDQGDGGVKG